MTKKKRPGAGGAGPHQNVGSKHSLRFSKIAQGLQGIVQPGVAGGFRKQFMQRVMSQLPGVPEPRIIARLMAGTRPVEEEAQAAAEHYQEPVAVVSMDGQLLAYRIPSVERKHKRGGSHEG